MDDPQKAENADALAKAKDVLQTLLTRQQSVMIATTHTDGSPLASYAPFVVDDDKTFYIFTSTLSGHTENLVRTGRASLMLIADESETAQIFARQRLTFACRAEVLMRDTQAWQDAATLYEARFASMFKLISGLGDFKMFKLVPQAGTLVAGFGQAYTLHGDALDQLTLRQE